MLLSFIFLFFFFKQKTAYEMRISDWSSDVCSSDLHVYDERAFQVLVSRYGNLRVDTVLSEPAGETGRRRGTLADALLEDLSAPRGARVYVAGPPEMVSSVTAAISGSGIGRAQIHADPFPVSGQDAAARTTALGRPTARG